MNESMQQLTDFSDMKREGTIELRPIDPKRFHTLTFTSYKDKNGVTQGIVLRKNPNTFDIEFRRISITGVRFYNLENVSDAIEWHVVKGFYAIKGSPNASGKPLMQVYDAMVESIGRFNKILSGRDCLDLALKMEDTELKDFARYLGFSPETNKLQVVKTLVAEYAFAKPEEFMLSYNNANRHTYEAFNRAMAVGLIKQRQDTGFVYNDSYPLGTTEMSAILLLNKDRNLLAAINAESTARMELQNKDYRRAEPEIRPVQKTFKQPSLEEIVQTEARKIATQQVVGEVEVPGSDSWGDDPQEVPVPEEFAPSAIERMNAHKQAGNKNKPNTSTSK